MITIQRVNMASGIEIAARIQCIYQLKIIIIVIEIDML